MNVPDRREAATEAIRRVNALRAEANDNVRDQHLVSQVILRQFTDATRHLHPVSVTDAGAVVRPIGPRGVGKMPNFVAQASRSAEELWAETENRIPDVLKLCDQGRLHDDPQAVAVAKDILALHHIRNPNTLIVHERIWRHVRAEIRQRTRTHPRYEQAFYREYGMWPPMTGDEAAGLLFDRLAWQEDQDFDTGLSFRASIERVYEQVRGWLTRWPVEVVHPASGMFIIGDSPVILLDRHGRMGPVEGVAVGDADLMFMPIAPHCLIAFGPEPAVGTIPAHIVEELNAFQVRAAREYVFVHPESGLEDFVRRVRFGMASDGFAES